MIRIAIIDDGINNIDNENIWELEHDIIITPKCKITPRNEKSFNITHGTICATILKKYYATAKISSIKILNSEHKASTTQLIRALDWCSENGIQIANMSLGSIDFRDYEKIRQAVNSAYHKGLIMIAANSNKDVRSFPAFFSNVIGVRCKYNLVSQDYCLNIYPSHGIDIDVSTTHSIFDINNDAIAAIPSNSYATPFITAIVAQYLQENSKASIEDIRMHLSNIKNDYNPHLYSSIDWVDSAFVFSIVNKTDNAHISLYANYLDIVGESVIVADTLLDGIKKIEHEITNIDKRADTIIIHSNFKANQNESVKLDNLNSTILRKQKNTIFAIEGYNPKATIGKTWASHIRTTSFYDRSSNMDIPLVLYISSDKDTMINNMLLLSSIFKENDFNAIAVSTEYDCSLYGMKKLSDVDNWFSNLSYITDKFVCDIIFFCINHNNNIPKPYLAKADIILYDDTKQINKLTIEDNMLDKLIIMDPDTINTYHRIIKLLK